MGLDLHYQVLPDDCQLLVRSRLEPVDLDMFGAHWNPIAIQRASVYKIHQSESDESFRYLQELFGQFKAFYAAIADRDGVIICMS